MAIDKVQPLLRISLRSARTSALITLCESIRTGAAASSASQAAIP